MAGSILARRLTRAAGGRSRRSALRTALGGATLGAALLASGAGGEAKNKHKKKKKCKQQACQPVSLQGEACTSIRDCCGNETHLSCAAAISHTGRVSCGTFGAPCVLAKDCCSPLGCGTDGKCGGIS